MEKFCNSVGTFFFFKKKKENDRLFWRHLTVAVLSRRDLLLSMADSPE